MEQNSQLYTPQYGQVTQKQPAALFQVEVDYTFQDLLALNQLVGKTARKWWMRISRIILGLLGCYLLVLSALLFGMGSVTVFNAVALLVGLLSLALIFFYHYLNAWQSKRLMMKFNGAAHFAFGAEEFSECTSMGSSQHPYNVVYAVYHFKDRFFIMMDKKHSYILPEAGFTQGVVAEFPQFLKEKMGKQIEYIR